MGMPFPYAVKKARNKPGEHEESVETEDRSVARELSRRAAMIGIHFSASSITNKAVVVADSVVMKTLARWVGERSGCVVG